MPMVSIGLNWVLKLQGFHNFLLSPPFLGFLGTMGVALQKREAKFFACVDGGGATSSTVRRRGAWTPIAVHGNSKEFVW